jgi:hypothetical protein
LAQAEEKRIPSFLVELKAKMAKGFNQESARLLAEEYFDRSIRRPVFRQIYNEAGFKQERGRPKKNSAR